MNVQAFENKSKELMRLERQHVDEIGREFNEATIENLYLSEETRDVLLTFPAETEEKFQETAEMLLNIQILFGRPLTPGEAGLILYSCFDSETHRDRRPEEPMVFGQAATEKSPRRSKGILGCFFRQLFGRSREA